MSRAPPAPTLLNQIESGVYCPLAMTYGAVPTLRQAPAIAARMAAAIFARDYDRRFVPAREKTRGAASAWA